MLLFENIGFLPVSHMLSIFYVPGALEILKNIDNIDLTVFYSGRICWDEVSRVKRLARTNCIRVPQFAQDMEKYRKKLKHMAHINGFDNSRKITSLSFHNMSMKSATKLQNKKMKQKDVVKSKVMTSIETLPNLNHVPLLETLPCIVQVGASAADVGTTQTGQSSQCIYECDVDNNGMPEQEPDLDQDIALCRSSVQRLLSSRQQHKGLQIVKKPVTGGATVDLCEQELVKLMV